MVRIKKNYLFVDGYNIINSWPSLKKLKDYSFEDARKTLIDEMAEFQSLSSEKVIVVFDAYKSGATKERYEEVTGIKVVFTKAFQTADAYIEKEIDRLARRENVRVCTGDNQIQTLALERGATRLTAAELRSELKAKRNNIKRAKRKDAQINRKAFPLSNEILEKLDQWGKDIK